MEVDPVVEEKVRQLHELVEQAKEIEATAVDRALELYRQAVFFDTTEGWKVKEDALTRMGEILAKQGRVADLRSLLASLRPLFPSLPKAKTAKIVRNFLEYVAQIPNTTDAQIEMCLEWAEWCKQEKRSYLKQRIDLTLAALYLVRRRYNDALDIVTALAREVKKLDDKILLVEIFLLESRIHHALKNLSRARAALTAARTNANAIYCPPVLQAAIDMQAGTLYAEELDYKTAYSYFYEAFEGHSNLGDHATAISALKYMLLCKIMTNHPEEVHGIIGGNKLVPQYLGRDVEAMKAIATAYSNRSLADFEVALKSFPKELEQDALIKSHLGSLNDNLLEQNLVRIVEPFSRVEISHVAKLIGLPVPRVEQKLSQMILDKKFLGTLDQGEGCLLVSDPTPTDETYPAALETLRSMGTVVESLFDKCKKL